MAAGARPPVDIKSRLIKFAGFLFLWILIIVARLTWLQVLEYREWVQKAERQQQRTVEISPQRGIIYDRNGQELAMTVQVDSIFAVPSEVREENQKTTAALLAGVTGEDATGILERMQSQRNFAWVARKVDSETAARVRSLGLRGIYSEKELQQAMRETQAVSGTAVVQNPRTGEILALANAPSFNPNIKREITPEKLKNHAVSDIYEPGSVFKTVTYSAVFEEKLARPEEVISCDPGFIVVGGIRIRDAHHIGTVTLEKAYAQSSDVGAVKMALRLGPERFYKHIQDYGFGQSTSVELPGETRGLLRKPGKWAASSIGSMAIGQEVGVTPLQVVSMMSAVANDGIYSPPRIVAGVTPPDQGYQRLEFRPQGQHRVISSYTAAIMRRLTEEVVLEGTARRAILDGYTSAGKTGTAQKIDPRTHTYSKTDYVASFVGFAPVNSAAITVAEILDSPRGLHQGGQVSAPVFNRIAAQVLAYLGVPHDVEPKYLPARRALVARAAEKDIEDAEPNAPGQTMDLGGSVIPSTGAPMAAVYPSTPTPGALGTPNPAEQPLAAPEQPKIDVRFAR